MSRLSYSRKLLGEILQFAAKEKVYWIVPLVLILGLAGLLILSSQVATPFIYTLF